MKRLLVAISALALSSVSRPVAAQEFAASRLPEIIAGVVNLNVPHPEMKTTLLSKAQPDECFAGIGEPYPPLNPDGTCSSGIPKRNQSYVWGLTQSGRNLWFGTAPNVLCQVIQSLGSMAGGGSIEIDGNTVVCEGDAAQSGTGDIRPAKIYRYNLTSKAIEDKTPADIALVNGLRSAGSFGGIVFLAGPSSITGAPGVTMYAYDAQTEQYLGSHTFAEYSDIRKWVVFKDALYTAVQNSTGGGSVLRWRGSSADLWNFEAVGALPNAGANIAIYANNQLAVSTWPSGAGRAIGAGVYVSPQAGSQGLTPSDAANWKEVFLFRNYEPDLALKSAYFGGDLAFFDGWLYWGSMHVPGLSAVTHSLVYGANAAANEADLAVGTWRSTSLWRGRNLGASNQEIELLYGEKKLAKYDWNPVTQTGTKTFSMVPTGWTPKYGKSGFGNIFNGYTWVMAVANGSLFVGTLDISYLLKGLAGQVQDNAGAQALQSSMLPLPADILGKVVGYGADIWRFDSSRKPAVLESRNGAGNEVNYGIRTMQVDPNGEKLYAGSANPFNIDPNGGWELLKLSPKDSKFAHKGHHGRHHVGRKCGR